jgi:hypothetical protein
VNAVFIVIGGLLVAQALLFLFGNVKRGWKLGPRLQSIVASDAAWRAGLRVIAPLQMLGGAALVVSGVTRSESDNAAGLVAALVLTLLGTYLGHRAAVRATP